MFYNIKEPILITGPAGFIGSNLLRKCVDEKLNVNVFLRKSSNTWRIEDILDKVQVHNVDLSNTKEVQDKILRIKPRTIFHLAAYGAYEYQDEIDNIKQAILDATMNLIRACSITGFNIFVNTGSNSEYGFKRFPMKETDLLTPNSYYAVFKAASSMFCQYESISKKLPIVTVRPFHVYGPYEEKTRLIPTLISKFLNNECPPLTAPDIARDMIYVEDVVNFYLFLTNQNIDYGSIFNLGTGAQYSLQEVVDLTLKLTDSKVKPIWNTMQKRKWDQISWEADINKVKKFFGWTPINNLENGLSKTINWYKNHNRN